MDTRLNYSIATDIFEAAARADKPREYLGMSEAGHPCDRHIWYKFHRFTPTPTDPRIFLLFRFGDKVEELICTHLRMAGYKLENAWPDHQAAYVALGGLLHGHSDGAILLPEGKALLECKSANKKKFQAFVLGGVRKVYEKYYWQAQLYMGFGGFDRALFVVVCKDDSNIYTEIVPFSRTDFDQAVARIHRIVTSPAWPVAADLPDCQYCEFRLHCKTCDGVQTNHSCMSCSFMAARPDTDPPIACTNDGHPFPIHHPGMICPDYSFLGEVPF